MDLKLIYVDTPFWRAEVPRIALHHGSIPFKDERISRKDFLNARKSGLTERGYLLPFKQIPVLIVDNVSLSQTGAISRFCGKISGLYPSNNDLAAARIDQVIDMATDITVLFSTYRKSSENKLDLEGRKLFFDSYILPKLFLLENSLSLESNFLNGEGLTIADITIWRVIGWLSSGLIEGFPTNFIHKLPTLQKICLNTELSPVIIDWIEKTYPENYIRGHYGSP